MTPRMKRFAEEYAISLNATASAIAAGYSAKTAYSAGARLLKHVEVQNFLGQAAAQRMTQLDVTPARIKAEAGAIATSDIRDLFAGGRVKVPSEWSDRFAAAVRSVTLLPGGGMKVTLWDKNAAQALLMKCFGIMPAERLEVTVDQADELDAMSDQELEARLERLLVLMQASSREAKHGQRAIEPQPLRLLPGRHARSKAEAS